MSRELGHELTPFEEVRRTILDLVEPLGSEQVHLRDASGRVLAEDLSCGETVPPFDNSAMDGYVVRSGEIDGASEDHPVTLAVEGIIAAGDASDKSLWPGTARRIMTGARLPPGGEAVVPHELTRFTDTQVTFFGPVPAGKNVRFAGGDMRPGDVPIRRGTRLGGPGIAVAATLGYRLLLVARRPRVAILSPGKELVEPWETPGPGQIRNSNAYGLAAFVRESGGIADVRPIFGDDPGLLRRAIEEAVDAGADALLSTGGVSAGDYDFVHAVVREDGRPGHVFKTAMRPGKPQVFGLLRGVPLFGLPGNPAAAIVSYVIFVRPGLRKLLGEEPWVPGTFPSRFTTDFAYTKGRVFMLRARVEPDLEGGCFRIAGTGDQDSSFLASLATANAIVELPGDRSGIGADEVFPTHWIHPR